MDTGSQKSVLAEFFAANDTVELKQNNGLINHVQISLQLIIQVCFHLHFMLAEPMPTLNLTESCTLNPGLHGLLCLET